MKSELSLLKNIGIAPRVGESLGRVQENCDEFGSLFEDFRVCLRELFAPFSGSLKERSVAMASRTSSPMSSPRSPLSRSSSEFSDDSGSPRVKPTAAEKLIDLKASAEEKITKASARLSEKAVLVRTNLALGLRRIVHHEQSPRHDKCLNYVAEAQTAATEKRLRKEQEARERAEWERAMAREWSIYKSSKHLEHGHTGKHLAVESRAHQSLIQGAA